MLFNSWIFVAFLAVVLAVTAPMRRYGTPWRVTLLAASYFFYAQWDWRYCGLILASTLVDYWLGLRLDARRDARRYLVASVTVNLGFLAFFKYANFLLETVNAAGSLAGLPPFRALDIVLPVGISFVTFQAMSYTIDVYRGEMRARRSLLDYALFVAFFPQLLAGPIVRAREFFGQLDNPKPVELREIRYALVLVFLGLAKKIVFADSIAAAIDPAWRTIATATPFEALTAVYGFALQIYFDFSGYTDVAIGVALLLGFRFPANFDYPYVSLSIQEFWRRWHMTHSACTAPT
jgi:D-alanyl-lipoteichoic acid acyltransferase DltB (MBOAT superfamily)